MDFKTSQKLYSAARMGKYARACCGDKGKTMQLYRFDGVGGISTAFARRHYQLICEYIGYMGQQPDNVLSWSEKPDEILNKIDNLYNP